MRLRSWIRRVLPLLVAAGFLAWARSSPELPTGVSTPLAVRTLALLAILLGAWLQRGRAAIAALVVWGVNEADRAGVPATDLSSSVVLRAAWAPVGSFLLGLLVWWVEAPLLSRKSVTRCLAVGGLVFLGALLARPELLELVTHLTSLGSGLRDRWALPEPFLLGATAMAGVLVGFVGWLLRRRALDGGLFAASLLVWASSGTVWAPFDATATTMGALAVLSVALVDGAARLAFEDSLTGLPARRALEERLDRLSGSYCLAMVDLDKFKRLNDKWGHDVGDQVLELVASRLARVGAGGEAFRYGGEEMTIVFDRRTIEEAESALETLRQEIADHPFRLRQPPRKGGKKKSAGQRIPVTVSIGVASSSTGGDPRSVLEAADKALYRAKKGGRDRVVASGKRVRRKKK